MDYSKGGGQGTASCRSLTGLLQSHQVLCTAYHALLCPALPRRPQHTPPACLSLSSSTRHFCPPHRLSDRPTLHVCVCVCRSNFFSSYRKNLLNEYYCKLKNIQLLFIWFFTFLWRKWISDFVTENFPPKLSSKLFLPFYSETISFTKLCTYTSLLVLMRSIRWCYWFSNMLLSLGENVRFVKVLWKIQIYKYLNNLQSDFILL